MSTRVAALGPCVAQVNCSCTRATPVALAEGKALTWAAVAKAKASVYPDEGMLARLVGENGLTTPAPGLVFQSTGVYTGLLFQSTDVCVSPRAADPGLLCQSAGRVRKQQNKQKSKILKC